MTDNKRSRRPDVVLFVNGLPLAVLELKNAAAESATIWSAFQKLQTYQAEVPVLFASNPLLAVSDGVEVRVATLGAGALIASRPKSRLVVPAFRRSAIGQSSVQPAVILAFSRALI